MLQWRKHINFYRAHLLCFTIAPIVFALIFWACNGRFKISYTDALFVSISAVTGTGLSTIDLSFLTAWQQTILLILELTGNQVFVSWIIVYVRRSFYREHLGHIVREELKRSSLHKTPAATRRAGHRAANSYPQQTSLSSALRPDMVRRVDVAPRLINPEGLPARSTTIDDGVIARSMVQSHSLEGQEHSVLRARGPDSVFTAENYTTRREVGFGGFPGPHELLARSSRALFPSLYRGVHRTLTIPRTSTLVPQHDHNASGSDAARTVRYLSFETNVNSNSQFQGLTEEQLIELGGVEYRALTALLWIVPLYYLGLLAIAIAIITPYMALPRWSINFLPPQQHRKISSVWFSIFQVAGAWANTGLSLVDQNMLPFQTAYLLIIVLIVCVLAGNTAFPIFFRFTIWIFLKILPSKTRTKEALQFLLDHPRRCFISLFPSPHTWLLFITLLVLTSISLAGTLILNIGNPAAEVIPVGTRVALAFLSSAAVRSAGFQGVAVSSLTPATQILYVILMYIAIYPIAISVRATNVYQERSLGIYPHQDDDEDDDDLEQKDKRVEIWGKYLMRHVRKQLSFDIWWLALSLFLLCIIERDNLMDSTKASWFNVFALLFEVVSAYGTVGLSLGIPTANYSLSGAFHVLSKLIICAVMLRGRHRGLPVALDRAVMLPHELRLHDSNMAAHEKTPPPLQHGTSERPTTSSNASGSKDRDISASSEDLVLRGSSREEERKI